MMVNAQLPTMILRRDGLNVLGGGEDEYQVAMKKL